MKNIIWELPDGTIAVTVPVGPIPTEMTEAEYLDEIAAAAAPALPDGTVRRGEVETKDVPARRRWRNAWRHDGSKVVEDLTAAKAVKAAELAAERDALVKVKVQEFVETLSAGDPTDDITDDINALKALNMGNEVAAARDLTALDAVKPAPMASIGIEG